MNGTTTVKNTVEEIFFLSDLLGAHAYFDGRKVGRLKDMVALDQGKVAEVTHFQIARPFGEAPLLVPFPKVRSFSPREIIVNNGDPGSYVRELSAEEVPLRDYLIDKKVLDTEGREVEVVYDIRLVRTNGHLYVSDVEAASLGPPCGAPRFRCAAPESECEFLPILAYCLPLLPWPEYYNERTNARYRGRRELLSCKYRIAPQFTAWQ